MRGTGIEFERATIGRSAVTSQWRMSGLLVDGREKLTLAVTIPCDSALKASAGARWSIGEEAPDCVFGWNQSTGERHLEQPVEDRVRRVGDRLRISTPLAWLGPVALDGRRARVTAIVNRDGVDVRTWAATVVVGPPAGAGRR